MARLIVLAALALAASGCTLPSTPMSASNTSSEPAVDKDTYHIGLDWTSPGVPPGTNFTFGMHVDGTVVSQSTHVGAHFGTAPSDAPSTTVYASKCKHASGQLPNDFRVECTAPATAGTYYLRGHAQEVRGNTTINWWSEEVTFTVQ
jgi:hypothetical protein